jgi:hypothetical protein
MPGYSTLTASWPIAVSNSREWQAWNKAILDSAEEILASGDREAMKPSSSGWRVESYEDNSVEVTLGLVGPRLVTATVQGTWWRGGHPSGSYIELNWMLTEKRELRPEDVFKPGSGWETLFQRRCEDYLNTYIDPPGSGTYHPVGSKELTAELHSIFISPRNWHIDEKGISIVFPEYAVAPRILHPGPVNLPWRDLSELLQPQFPISEH